MKRKEGKGPPSADLLFCFPSRAHLTLMPKTICSPARPSEPKKRQHNHHHSSHHHHPPHHHPNHNHHHHLIKKSSNRNGVAGQASPILWAKNKPMSKEIDEPTSPKVTCAGQIKVKPKASSCKNWQSVMEEIERLHNKSKHKKRPAWVEALRLKKDVMQLLTCLRSIRFDFRCFGAYPSAAITSDDGDDVDEDDDGYHQDHHQKTHLGKEARDDHDSDNTSRTVFSRWFMVLQESNSTNKTDLVKTDNNLIKEEAIEAPCAPPPNALLLMRCRSAPAKSWLEEKEEEADEEEEESHDDDDDDEKQRKEEEDEKRIMALAMEEEKKRKDNLVVMRCGTADFYKFSSDIAKETWVVGGIRDSLSRSRSWKR